MGIPRRLKLKLNALQNYSPRTATPNQKQKTSFQPSFGDAKVVLIEDARDVISTFYVNLKEGNLQTIAKKITPILEKFDDNLIFTVSPTKKDQGFLGIFCKEIFGLKVNIKYFDQKKAYYEILQKKPQEQLLRQDTLNGLMTKDKTLLSQLGEYIGVGKYFRPQTESEDKYVETLVNMIKEDIILMPKRLLENKHVIRDSEGKFNTTTSSAVMEKSGLRNLWAWYRGIEY